MFSPSEVVLERPSTTDESGDDDLCHIVCSICYPGDVASVALCSTFIPANEPWVDSSFEGRSCVVCEDLALSPCPGCGQ